MIVELWRSPHQAMTIEGMSAYMFEHAKDQPVLQLDQQQAEKLLRNTRHGRLAFMAEERVEIFPLNYAFDGKTLYFRTGAGTKLRAAQAQAHVTFETDGVLPDEAWSVVVRGHLTQVPEDQTDYVHGLGLSPWVPTYKDFFMSLNIDEISGRHFIFARQPERREKEFSYDPNQPSSTPPDDPDPTRLSR